MIVVLHNSLSLSLQLDRVKHELEEIQYNTDKRYIRLSNNLSLLFRHVSITHKAQLQQQLEEREVY